MDLVEFQKEGMPRHPWETSRVKAIKRILAKYIDRKNRKILDVGCGDCFAITELFKDTDLSRIDAIDVNLSEEQASEFAKHRGISVYTKYDNLKTGFYDTIIAQDVIEHVEDPVAFLTEITGRHAAPEVLILITVPAFNTLYSSHDSFLGHIRRYNTDELKDVLNLAGLKVVESGYLFFTLLIVRFLTVYFQRLTNLKIKNRGVGAWKHGTMLSKFIELALVTDNCISLFLNRLGLKIPGLSAWSLCKKQ